MRVRLGKVMLTPRGAHNNSTSYDFLDVVYKYASSYVSLSYENMGHDVTDTNYWQPLVDGAYIETYFDSRFIKRLSLSVPQGMSVSGSPVTAPEGTLAITLDNGYALLDSLTSSKINVAYNMRHTHINLDLLNQITAARMAHWDAGGGGGGGGTTTEYDARYVKIEWFTQLFKAMDSSNNSLSVNGALTGFTSIQATKSFWSQGGVSALGTGSSGGGGGGGEGVSLNTLLDNLNNSTLGGSSPAGNEGKVLGYTANGWAFVTPSSGGSSTLEGLTDTIISNPANGQVLTYNGQKWVNSAAPSSTDLAAVWASLSGATDNYAATKIHANHIPDLSNTYLPKTGGTVTGNLSVNGTLTAGGVVHIGQNGYFENYNLGKFYLPSGNGTYTLATTADLDNYVSKNFLRRLLQAFDSNGNEIEPNSLSGTIDNIKAMADFWSAGAVAALGTSSGSGGSGTGVKLNSPLAEINQQLNNRNPSAGGSIIVYDGGIWGYRTLASITGGYVPTSRIVGVGNGLTGGGALSSDITIRLSDTTLADIANGVTAYGWGNHAEAGYADDDDVVHKAGAETIKGDKTFTASLIASNGVYLNKSGQQQWVNFNNGLKNFSFGQEGSSGDCVLYSGGNVNFYTNINNNPYALFVQGSSGNVGIGTNAPTNKLDVNGVAHVSNRIWSDVSIGARTSETNGFRFEWDQRNNAVVVMKADGTPCNFYSMGGVSALGVGSSGTPNISSMNIGTLTVNTKLTSRTAQVQNTLTVGSGNYEGNIVIRGNDGDDSYESIIYQSGDILNIEADSSLDISGATSINGNTSITGTLYVSGTTSLHDIKVGSSGSVIKSITWNSSTSRLDVVIGSNTYSFQPVS